MSKYGTDERGWPLVPCDPAAIPEGHEPVRVGLPRAGELCVRAYGGTHCWSNDVNLFDPVRLIVRPIKPIEFPLMIVPHGHWVIKDRVGVSYVCDAQPWAAMNGWSCTGNMWALPSYIAAQLPSEWHSLPWDKSAMQQTRGEA